VSITADLAAALARFGFVDVPCERPALAMLKRQTWNTNRAVVAAELTGDVDPFVTALRDDVAKRCRCIPVLWPIGIQMVILARGADIDPSRYVALVDNQWALIQSMFVIDPGAGTFREARSWGQVITGKYQNAIGEVLSRHYGRR
jgi:hypothetical protein